MNMIQKTMAKRMTQSAQEIPQFAVSMPLDADALSMQRNKFNAGVANKDERVSVTAMLVWLTARALRMHPAMNAQFDGDAVIIHEDINISVAMTTTDGLTAPVIRQADRISIHDTVKALKDLVSRAEKKRLVLDDFKNATFTISNLGMMGVTRFTPLVNPPQAAIMGIGGPQTIVEADATGSLKPVHVIEVTVSADHRVLDGAAVARFLQTLQQIVAGQIEPDDTGAMAEAMTGQQK